MTLTDSQALALERLAGSLIVQIAVEKAWAAWRSLRATRQERQAREDGIRARKVAIKCIRRRLRRYV